jgi:hypothetical protein
MEAEDTYRMSRAERDLFEVGEDHRDCERFRFEECFLSVLGVL